MSFQQKSRLAGLVGLVGFAIVMDEAKLSSRVGLNVMATVVATLLVGGVRAIHGKRNVSLWLALGPLTGALGFYLTFYVQW